MSTNQPTPTSFGERVRDLMIWNNLSAADLAKTAGMSPSWLSRLLSENEQTRRKAGMDDVLKLATALEVKPAELVRGTEVEEVFGDWFPREAVEREIEARHAAQQEAAELRTKVAGLERQVELLGREHKAAAKLLIEAKTQAEKATRNIFLVRLQLADAEASRDQAIRERDEALRLANHNYLAWKAADQDRAKAAILGGVLGAVGTLMATDPKPAPKRRRSS